MQERRKFLIILFMTLAFPSPAMGLETKETDFTARVTYYARYNLDRARLTLQYRSLSPANLAPLHSEDRRHTLTCHRPVTEQNLRFGYWTVYRAGTLMSLQAGGYSSFSLTGQWHRPFIKLSLNRGLFFSSLKGAMDLTRIYQSGSQYLTPRFEGSVGYAEKNFRLNATVQGLLNLDDGEEGHRYPFRGGKRFSHEERLNFNLSGVPFEPYVQLAFLPASKFPSEREWRLAAGFFFRF